MTRAIGLVTAVVVALLAATFAGAQPGEAPAARARLEAGRSWTYDLTLDVLAKQGESTTRVVQSARLELSVVEAGEQGALVQGKVSRLVTMWVDGTGQVEFSWTRENDPDVSKTSSPSEAFTEMCRAIANATLEARVAKDGTVQGVAGLEKALAAAGEDARFGPAALGMFAPAQIVSTLQPVWRADELVTTNGRAGTGWQTTRDVPLGVAGQLRFVTDWVITGVEGGVASYTGDESASVMRPTAPDPAAPSMELTAHDSKLSGAWSLGDGALSERTQERSLAATYRLGELSLTQDQRVKATMRLVR